VSNNYTIQRGLWREEFAPSGAWDRITDDNRCRTGQGERGERHLYIDI
jgi:hypothetical protein